MDDVRRDDRVLDVLQDALQFVFGRLAEGFVDLLDGHLTVQFGREVGDGAVGHGHAQREAVELALQVRQYQSDRLGRAGRGGNDRQCRRTGPPQVAVRRILQALVGRIGMHRDHEAAPHAERLVEHLDHRRQAVRRAARVRDDLLLAGQNVVVDADHDGRIDLAFGRRRDDHLLGTGFDVLGRLLPGAEDARRFDHHVAVQLAPGRFFGSRSLKTRKRSPSTTSSSPSTRTSPG